MSNQMTKEQYEAEKTRILLDERYPMPLKQWMIQQLTEVYEKSQTKGNDDNSTETD